APSVHPRTRPREGPRRAGARPGSQWLGASLLVCETAFLVAAGGPLWSSSSTLPAPTPQVKDLQHLVGTSLVAFGTDSCSQVGVLPDFNSVYGIRELGIFDPLISRAYYRSWRLTSGSVYSLSSTYFWHDNHFCPAVS